MMPEGKDRASGEGGENMEFGVLFTSHPNIEAEPYPHRDVHARVASADERPRLWQLMLSVYGGYADYQRRTEREIPLVVLEPR